MSEPETKPQIAPPPPAPEAEKPKDPPTVATASERAGETKEGQPFVYEGAPYPRPHRGLSYSPGLEEMGDSSIPGIPPNAANYPQKHVRGPGQNPADPMAAGLDLYDLETKDHPDSIRGGAAAEPGKETIPGAFGIQAAPTIPGASNIAKSSHGGIKL